MRAGGAAGPGRLEGRGRAEAAGRRPEDAGPPPHHRRHGAGCPPGDPGLPCPRAGGALQPVRTAHRPAEHGPGHLPPARPERPGPPGAPRQPDRRPECVGAATRHRRRPRAEDHPGPAALQARLGRESSGFSAGPRRRLQEAIDALRRRQDRRPTPTRPPTRPGTSPSSRPRPPSSRSRPGTSAAGSPSSSDRRRPPRPRPPRRARPRRRPVGLNRGFSHQEVWSCRTRS